MLITTGGKAQNNKWQLFCRQRTPYCKAVSFESKSLSGPLLVQYCRKSCQVVEREGDFVLNKTDFFHSHSPTRSLLLMCWWVLQCVHIVQVGTGSDTSKHLEYLFYCFWILPDAEAWMWPFHPKAVDSSHNFFLLHPVPPSRVVRKCCWFICCLFSSLAAVCLGFFFLIFLVFFYLGKVSWE